MTRVMGSLAPSAAKCRRRRSTVSRPTACGTRAFTHRALLADPRGAADRPKPPRRGTGVITEAATGYDGYTGLISKNVGTIAEVLRQYGYATSWFGKNHNTPDWETSQVGPFDRWPSGLGFDYFYGFMGGDMDQWQPTLYENHQLVPRSADPNYILTKDLVDKSIAWLRQTRAIDAEKPYFLYMATGRPTRRITSGPNSSRNSRASLTRAGTSIVNRPSSVKKRSASCRKILD